jgi:Ca2+-binding RTX toxin-like protein
MTFGRPNSTSLMKIGIRAARVTPVPIAEYLEMRRYLAVGCVYAPNRGTIVVTGDESANTIEVAVDDHVYTVTADGAVCLQTAQAIWVDIDNIEVFGNGAGDSITIEEEIDITTELQGHGGDDFIWGARARDSIIGGTGNDILFGRGGGDYLQGNAGNDALFGDFGSTADGADELNGGTGTDNMYGGGEDDYFKGCGDGEHDLIDGEAGNDTIEGGYDVGIDTLTSIENPNA